MKKLFALAAVLLAMSMLLSGAALAEDANNDGYLDADVAVVQQIISQSGILKNLLDINAPADWPVKGFAWWGGDPYSVHTLQGDSIDCTDFTGELDVSNLASLITLIMPNNPDLTSVALPNNSVNLSYVNISMTGVTALDVSHYPNLEILYASDINLTELDVSKNPNLKILYASNTNLTELDVSRNPNLEELSVSGTKLTELDISANSNLTTVILADAPITKLTTADGTLDLSSAPGASVFSYDPATGVIGLYADHGGFYAWNGLPENNGTGDTYVEFKLTGDITPYFTELPPAGGGSGMSSSSVAADLPQTGDNSSLPLSAALLLGSCALFLLLRRRARA